MAIPLKEFPDGATAAFLDEQGFMVAEGDAKAYSIRITQPDGTVIIGLVTK